MRDYDPSLPDLLLDRDQLTQAFLNLARNASQATDDSRHRDTCVPVCHQSCAERSRHYKLVALIDIRRRRPGCPGRDCRHDFLSAGHRDRKDGTGIGLPLAQDLVNRHGGLIEFDPSPARRCSRSACLCDAADYSDDACMNELAKDKASGSSTTTTPSAGCWKKPCSATGWTVRGSIAADRA